jgi:hypothetical protein
MTEQEHQRIQALTNKIGDLFRAEGPLGESMPVISTALTEIVGKWLSTFEDGERMAESGAALLQHAFVIAGAETDRLGGSVSVKTAHREPCMVADRDHQISGSPETQAAVHAVLAKARSLGLYGALIMSPKCPGCGALHDFGLISNLKFGRGGTVSDLLMDFAFTASQQQGEEIPNSEIASSTPQ